MKVKVKNAQQNEQVDWTKNNTSKQYKMKQTAVEWLYNYLFPKKLDGFSDEEWNKIDLAFKQAKEMEKHQREKDLEIGFHTGRLYQGREGDTTLEQLKEKTFKPE